MNKPTELTREFKHIGQRIIRPDGVEKVTGRAAYGADGFFPDMCYGKILRSPHAHARILSIDTSEALAMRGVKAVVTGADLPTIPSGTIMPGENPIDLGAIARNVIARDKVLYHGHAVAAVAATSQQIAEQALKKIRVEYAPLPHVLEVLDAMQENAPLLDENLYTKGVEPKPTKPSNVATKMLLQRGEIETGFAAAAVVVEREFKTETVHQGYIEPHAALASVAEDGQTTIWASSQGHFMIRAYTAKMLGMPVSKIKVIPAEIGGGFGGKTVVYLEPLAVVLARKSGKAVKLVMTRDEVFRATGPTSGANLRVKLGVRKDGALCAVQAWMAFNAGAFPGSPMGAGLMGMLAPYKVENFRLEGYDVLTNRPKTTAYRAPGVPISAFAVESLIDEAAEKLGMDPIDLRLVNAVEEGDTSAYGPKFKAVGFKETLRRAKQHPHYSAPLGPNQGRGIACGFWFNAGMSSSASVKLNEDGTVLAATGSPDIGGSRAAMAMMCAEELGVEVERIRPIVADTESVGYCDVTGGSRTTFATGQALMAAARDMVGQLRQRAAMLWETDVAQVEWLDGVAYNLAKPGTSLSLAEIAAKLDKTGGPVVASATVNARGAGPSLATHLVDVKVDPETGKVDVIRYTGFQDVGKAIHPSYVEGQMEGGAAQGIGWALNEEYVYDKNGIMQNAGFLDYRMPVALDLPMIESVMIECPNPYHPLGVRGVGEVSIVPGLAAIANAINDAVGVRLSHAPMSPPKVLKALDEKAAS